MRPRTIAAAMLIGGVAAGLGARLFVVPGAVESPSTSSAHVESAREFWAAFREATRLRVAGDCRGAVARYTVAVGFRPDHEDSLYYLGNCLLELGAYHDALQTYRRLVAINPDGSSRAYVQSALVHASFVPGAPRDLREAERLFQRALDLDPDSGALLGLAEVAILLNDTGRAQTLLERVSAEDSMSMAAPYLLGYLSWRAGRESEAWRLFRLAVARGELKKPPVTWSEEGDVKADPELRWRALARQSVFGRHWIRLRAYAGDPDPARADMEREYRQLEAAVAPASPR